MKISRKWRRMWQKFALAKSNCKASVKRYSVRLAAGLAAGVILSVGIVSGVQAAPAGGQVTAGQGSIVQNGANTTITQMSDKLAVNWQSFNIGQQEKVQFIQPTSQSVALNRVVGNSASQIYGQLSANGKVFLINTNGILFSPTARVDTGALVASTLNMTDSDFLAGKYVFAKGSASGSVINQGQIQAADGGYVALLGEKAVNEGVIVANQGSVALAAGEKATLDMTGDGLIKLGVDQAALNAQVENKNLIQADGGLVVMTAKAAGDLAGTVVNNSGVIRAQSLTECNGKIVLDGGQAGSVEVSGTLDASGKAAGQTGGQVDILGQAISLAKATVDASGASAGGQVHIGGDFQGQGDRTQADTVFIDSQTVIDASSADNGDGGQVVVWSNKNTAFYGQISANGGANGGNGGMVETSGKRYLNAQGTATAAAPKGKAGQWLLDPGNITIQSSIGDSDTPAVGNGNTYDPYGGNAVLLISTIDSALNSGTNVIVTTTSSGIEPGDYAGDITVNGEIAKTTGGEATLTLNAYHDIIISSNSMITSTADKLNVEFNAGNEITLNSNINTNGGNATLVAGGNMNINYAIQGGIGSGSTVTLTAGSGKTVSGNGNLQADHLLLNGAGATYTLNTASKNMIGTLAAAVGSGSVSVKNMNQLTIGTVGAVNGIQANSVNLAVSSGDLTVNKAVNSTDNTTLTASDGNINLADTISGSTVTLTGSNGKTVSGNGNITAANLLLNGSGATYQLNTATDNAVGTLAAAIGTGSLNFANSADLAIGTVGSTSGITAKTATVTANTGNLSVTKAIKIFGDIALTATSGNITHDSNGSVKSTNEFAATLTEKANQIAISAPITSLGAKLNVILNANSTGNTGNAIALNSNITTRGGNLVLGGGADPTTGVAQDSVGAFIAGDLNAGGGDIIINGKGLNGDGINLMGTLQTSGNGSITLNGTSVQGGSGVRIQDTIQTQSGNISLIGTGNTLYSAGVLILDTATVKAANGGSIAIAGNLNLRPDGLADYCAGVDLYGNVEAANGGSVTITGTTGSGVGDGVYIDPAGKVQTTTSGTGSITITGTGSGGNSGIWNEGTLQTFNGNIILTGTGSTGSNDGIYMTDPGQILAGNTGTITMNGIGTGIYHGVDIRSGTVEAENGNITLNGQGGNGGYNAYGVWVNNGASVITTGSGSISITGTADASGELTQGKQGWKVGIMLGDGNGTAGDALVQAASGGNIIITGSGGTNAGKNNYGLYMDTAGKILANAGGIITITAQGGSGSSDGAYIDGSIEGENGAVTVSGNAGASGAGVRLYTDGKIATTGGDISVLAHTSFVNSAGANALAAANGGKWLVYSTSPLADTRGGLSYDFKQYNASYKSTILGTGNGFVYSVAPQVTVGLTGQATKEYDGDEAASFSGIGYNFTGLLDGDTFTNITASAAAYDNKNAGSGKSVTVSGLNMQPVNGSAPVYGYSVGTSASGNIGTITPKALTITGTTVSDKTYNGTTAADISLGTLSGFVEGENVTVTGSGNFADKNAGTGKTVTVQYTLQDGTGGGLASNYSLANTTATADIDAKKITVSGITAADRTYDGTTAVGLNTGTAVFEGMINGDNLAIANATGTMADKNIGTEKKVSITGITLGGEDAGNYSLLTKTDTATVNISAKEITVSGITAVGRTYDGTTAVSLSTSEAAFDGMIKGDNLTVADATGTMADKNVGTDKKVSITGIALGGTDAGNYRLLTETDTAKVTIKAKDITVSGITGTDRTYDGTTAVGLNTGTATFEGRIKGDNLTIATATGTMNDKNAGEEKKVSITGITLGGTDAGNYNLLTTADTATVNISPKSLTVTGITVTDKSFDGTTTATLNTGSAGLAGVIAGDIVRLNASGATGAFDTPAIGSSKTVLVSGLALAGEDAANYSLPSPYAITGMGIITSNQPSEAAKTTAVEQTHSVVPATEIKPAPPVVQVQQNALTGSTTASVSQFIQRTGFVSAGNQNQSYSLSVTDTSVTLTLPGATTTPTATVAAKALPVVSVDTQKPPVVATYDIVANSSSVTVNPAINPGATPSLMEMPKESAAGAKTESFKLSKADGSSAEFSVTYNNGAISIKPLNEAAAEISKDEGEGMKVLAATGLLTVQDKLGIDANGINAVYINKQ